jgi:hypothetical protein
MAGYRAWMTDEETGNEGVYDFEGPDDLFAQTPVRVVRTFLEYVDEAIFPKRHLDYEINAALKHGANDVVTAMGSWIIDPDGPPMPFTLFIGRRK